MRKPALFLGVLFGVSCTSTFLVLFYTFLAIPVRQPQFIAQKSTVSFAALPTNLDSTFSGEITQSDARVELVRQVMDKYNSPLADVADTIVSSADKYKIDYRLIPALALKESGGCRIIPQNSYNCWGYGLYNGTRFDTYAEGVQVVSKALSTRFRVGGEVNPTTVMPLYTNGTDTTWASDIEAYMAKML
jgi:hypothetical protein